MEMTNQEKFSDTTFEMIGTLAKLPVIRVDREAFLRQQFQKSPHLKQILENGPQSVYTIETLKKKADEVINASTNKTTFASFAAGIPGNPLAMVALGGADVVQYFGFALNLSQQISYLFGDAELFDDSTNQISEDAKMRVVALLAGMFGVSGAANLIVKTSRIAGANIGKKVAEKALTKTAWYPLLKKTAAILGQKITKKTVEKTIAKAVPFIGGVISGGLTYITFKPMGIRLTDIYIKKLNGEYADQYELNPEFLKSLEVTENITDGSVEV